jgi:thiol-disulfide isomerase/thioredoxin
MELKNAVAVCLISLSSATLVVLIARTLDSQAASRLEPQLASIVEELRAIRKQGGIAASPGAGSHTETSADGLVVYYFHGNTRCPTCQSIESQAQETVQTDFASQLSSGAVTWKILNYEQPANGQLAKKFEIQMPVVVLAKMKAGQVEDWKRLDEVWALVGDKPAFAKHVREEIERMLAADKGPMPVESSAAAPAIPVPSEDPPQRDPAQGPLAIPVPQ